MQSQGHAALSTVYSVTVPNISGYRPLCLDQSGCSKRVHEFVYPRYAMQRSYPYALLYAAPLIPKTLVVHITRQLGTQGSTRFLKETDRTALRTTKLAAKLAVQLGKAGAKASAGGAAVASAEAASLLEPENMDLMAEVLDKRAALAAGEAELGPGAGGASATGARGKLTKREMGLLRWGKKNHKVGNKDPYGNPDAETVTSLGPAGAKVAGGGKKGRRGKKRDGFTRVTMPHHQTYSGPA